MSGPPMPYPLPIACPPKTNYLDPPLQYCKIANGDCGKNLRCEEVTIGRITFSDCVCDPGKYRTTLWTCEALKIRRNLSFRKKVSSVGLFVYDPVVYSRPSLVDGVLLGALMLHIKKNDPQWMAIDLEDEYEIEYVDIYNRQCANGCYTRVKSLKVGVNKTLEQATEQKLGKYDLCGFLPELSNYRAGKPLRITCTPKPVLGRFVIIQPSNEMPLGLNEVEVYEKFKRQPVKYVGCFEVFNSAAPASNSKEECQDDCEKHDPDNVVFAIKNGKCYCGGNADLFVATNEADGCEDNFAVYSDKKNTVSTIMGCFEDAKLEEKTDSNITVQKDLAYKSCFLYCKGQYSKEFAIKVDKCICGDLFVASEQVAIGECSVTCKDQNDKSCGAANRYSVYNLFGTYDFLERPQNNFCMNLPGSAGCQPGQCSPGCQKNNGGCGNKAQCVETIVENGRIISECKVPDGFKVKKRTDVMYLGCYWSVVIEKSTPVKSYVQCKKFCLAVRNIFMIGLQRGEACHCLSGAKYPVSSSHCDMKCSNGYDSCGGLEVFSVYQIKERSDFNKSLVGIDESDLTMDNSIPLSDPAMTIQKCMLTCLEKKSYYAKMKNESGNEPLCYCSKTSDTIKCLSSYESLSKCSVDANCLTARTDCFTNTATCNPLNCEMTMVLGKEYSECVCPKYHYKEHFSNCYPLPKTVNLAFGRKIIEPAVNASVFSNSSLNELELKQSSWDYAVDGNIVDWEVVSLLYIESSVIFFAGWMAVDLEDEYQIETVVIYPRKCDHQCKSAIVVHLNSSNSKSVECGRYPVNVKNCHQNDSINIYCSNTEHQTKYVIILKQVDVVENDEKLVSVFTFNEVEVYGAARKSNPYVYIGCFEQFDFFNSSETKNNYEDCYNFCEGLNIENYIFAIFNKSCYCGKDADVQIDKMETCDEHTVFSKHLNKPSYLGCFNDDVIEPRALSRKEVDTNSPFRSCLLYCNAYQFEEFAIKENNLCVCGDKLFSKFEQVESNLCGKCQDDDSKTCGSNTKFSLYKIYKALFPRCSARSSVNFANRWALRSALNFVNDGEFVREKGRNLFNYRNNPVNYHFCKNEKEIKENCQADCMVEQGDCGVSASCVVNKWAGEDVSECRYEYRVGLNKDGNIQTKPAKPETYALIDAGSVVPDDAKVYKNVNSLTIELCMKICAENALPLAYLTGADECQCSSREKESCGDPKNYGDNCNIKCRGNVAQKCGGKNCTAKFSDCQDLGGHCGELMKCNEIKLGEKVYSECVCPPGKYRTSQWKCADLPSKNVAFRKRVDTIPKLESDQAQHLVDGHLIRNPSTPVLQSPDNILITIHLDDLYKVQYVVVYHRPNFNNIGNQTNTIELDDILLADSLRIPCDTYEVGRSTCAEQPVYVDCKHPGFKSMFVFIFPQVTQKVNYLALDEIEVFADDSWREFYYVGCFGSFFSENALQSRNITFNECTIFCEGLQNPIFIIGLKNGGECHCGLSASEASESVNCNVMCSDGSPCGGPNHYIVFSADMPKPSYVGCYSEAIKQKSKMIQVDQAVSYTSCLVHCKTQNSIEFAIMRGTECLCGNLMDASLQVATSQCNQACIDDATMSCGGTKEYSLYKMSSRFEASSERHFCLDTSAGSPDCKPGRCDPGWTGPLCNKRDCSLNNGACPKDLICSKVFVGPEITSECIKTLNYTEISENETTLAISVTSNQSHWIALIIAGSFFALLLMSIGSTVAYVKMKHPEMYEKKVQQVKDFKAKVGNKLSKPADTSMKEAEPKKPKKEKVAKASAAAVKPAPTEAIKPTPAAAIKPAPAKPADEESDDEDD
ncbi:hypothetical protein HELRODRAFT_193494 [Helobdella robusta]|uniref:WSC domain-containing protein n=1 Tax=Helobdella robusta TaxID=6412 RepID=T1FV19_HELRO|nr:hypothetical protein HELRODRAFT_193494 [Helobdella robusta]ESN95851.1 hypothetical protein HELRODRAFT_193494 [Helobdella robusta]